MTIAIRQYREIYNKYLLMFLKEGRVPSFDEVIERAGSELPNLDQPATPLYGYIPQAADSVFDIHLYNRSVDNILTDLKVLFSELTDIEVSNIQRILHANLFHSVHTYELSRMNRQLDALLFSLQGAEDNFVSAFENFNDTSKTNTKESTKGIVDTYEGALALPIGGKGTLKIDVSHLYEKADVGLTVESSTGKIIGTLPETKFGTIFKDSQKVWGVIVDCEQEEAVSIKFTFSLKREEFINRITLLHHGSKSQTAFISTSVDNVNYKDIIEYSGGVLLDNQSKVASMDFADRLVEYITVKLSKVSADTVLTDTDTSKQIYRYIFALKNLSLYSTGRTNSGTYISKPFDFSSDIPSLSRVSISCSEKIPEDTSISWYIGLLEEDEQVGTFLAITPESRATSYGPSKIVNLQDTVTDSTYIVSTSTTYTNVFNYNSIPFYSIATLDEKPIFGTAKLYRGQRSWLKDNKGTINLSSVTDNFIPFSKGNIQKLYKIQQEVATLKSVSSISSQRVLFTTNAPLYTENGPYSLTPGEGVNVDKDTAPIYAIFSAYVSGGPIAKQKLNATFTSGSFDIGQPNILYSTSSDISIEEVVTVAFGNYSIGATVRKFISGTDYIVELDSNSKPTGRILTTQGSPLLQAPANTPNSHYVVKYSTDPDITRFITNIVSNQIVFTINATNTNVLVDDQVIIKYRFVPNNIIKSSVKVKAGFGNPAGFVVFKQGADYIFDVETSTIQRLSTGKILQDQDVYVDYQYNDNANGLQQYFLWAFISEPDGISIRTSVTNTGLNGIVNTLIPDTAAGEQLYANIQGLGLIKLTSATEWPRMSGWVQFVVRSISPSLLQTTSKKALIDQVISMKDREGEYIFVANGKYFKETTGIREPLKQTSLSFLKNNVLKNDRQYFAIKEIVEGTELKYQVVINFAPNSTDDLYSYTVDTNTNQIVGNAEEWKLNWSSSESDTEFKKIIVKAVLNRDASADGNITPKVYNYYLKASY